MVDCRIANNLSDALYRYLALLVSKDRYKSVVIYYCGYGWCLEKRKRGVWGVEKERESEREGV